MKKKITLYILFLFVTFTSNQVFAQQISGDIIIGDTTQIHILRTTNNDRFIGRVTKIENTTVHFLFQDKLKLEFQFNEIKSVELQGKESSYNSGRGRYLEKKRKRHQAIDHAGEQNLFFGPTAFTYGHRNGEYRNCQVFLNRADFGLSKNVDFGVDLLPLIAFNLIAIKAKVGFPVSKNLNLAVGGSTYLLFVNNFNNDEFTGMNHAYGIGTLGNKDRFISIGLGYAFPFDTEFEQNGAPVLNFGGAIRLNDNWKLTVESILISENTTPNFYALGANWIINPRNRLDFGFTVVSGTRNNFFGPSTFNVPVPFAQYAFMF